MVKHHNHFKIRINGPELLHYRSGKSIHFRGRPKALFATTLIVMMLTNGCMNGHYH